jgi:hypothetical protein
MIENLQWFLAILLVIAGAVGMGAACWLVVHVATGGVKRAARSRRCAMPARISNLMKGH